MDTFRPHTYVMPSSRAWILALGSIAVFAAWLVAGYWETVSSMVAIWYRSETFAHGFVVFPISAWLVWRQRDQLAAIEPSPTLSPWALAAFALAGVLWFAAELADVLAARHIAWITMLIAGIWVLTGNAVARRLVFPLGFLYFAVPMGEFLLPTLVEWTANFTVAALRASGVPVWRDGMNFQIPTGSWSVVEACSGLRYLIASVTVGALYAYLAYRSALRRAAFVAASVLVPVIANWFRAYMIVMLGHLSGNRLAVGVDHIIYGWIFFGVVILLLFWVGSFWREDDPAAQGAADASSRASAATGDAVASTRWTAALACVLILSAIGPVTVHLLSGNDVRGAIDASAPPLARWQPTPEAVTQWTPDFTPPRAAISSTYENGNARAGVYVALYFDQDRESKLVSSANQLVRTTDRNGYLVSEQRRTIEGPSGSHDVDESVVQLRDMRVVVRRWYWIDGETTASSMRAKLLQARARLAGRGDAGAIVVVWAPLARDGAVESAALDDMTQQAMATLPALLAERLHRPAVAR